MSEQQFDHILGALLAIALLLAVFCAILIGVFSDVLFTR